MAAEIDALLFDLGGVIIDIDSARTARRWAHLAGCTVEDIRKRYVQDEHYRRHERGLIDDNAYFASLRQSLQIELSDEQFLDGWNAIFKGVIPGIAGQLAAAAPHLPLYVFSNTNPAHEKFWSFVYADTLKPFREVFVSSTIGLRKPDAAAFDHVAKAIGAPPSRILFFDDSLANVEGARACGLQAVHVRSNADVAEALAAVLPARPPIRPL